MCRASTLIASIDRVVCVERDSNVVLPVGNLQLEEDIRHCLKSLGFCQDEGLNSQALA